MHARCNIRTFYNRLFGKMRMKHLPNGACELLYYGVDLIGSIDVGIVTCALNPVQRNACALRPYAAVTFGRTRHVLRAANNNDRYHYSLKRLSSNELLTTDTLESAIAAPANAGARIPTAASGIMMQL